MAKSKISVLMAICFKIIFCLYDGAAILKVTA